jgi:hypothetical protein
MGWGLLTDEYGQVERVWSMVMNSSKEKTWQLVTDMSDGPIDYVIKHLKIYNMKQITCIVFLSSLMITCMNPSLRLPYKSYVWCRLKKNNLTLYRDNQRVGQLPATDRFFTGSSRVWDSSCISSSLCMKMFPGRYELEVRDSAGVKISKGTLDVNVSERKTTIRSSWDNDLCSVKVIFDQED